MKHFKKYESIENSYRTAFIDKIIYAGFSKEEFIVEEKIHGSNFQFYLNDEGVTAGKRTSFLSENEKFFNWKPIFEKYKSSFEEMKERHFKEYDIIAFGELYGGSYPHPNVPQDSKWTRVQKEILYRPDEDFICFDIFIHNENEAFFLTVTDRNELCEKFNIPFAKTLFKGTLEECLQYPNTFLTTIPKLLGLPEIEDNICEGVVIRPEKDLRLLTQERAILKNKNEKFSEKKKEPKEQRSVDEIPEFIRTMLENIEMYINENRLNNMISKEGELNPKDFGKYIQLFSKDIYEDFFKDYSEDFKNWEKGEQKRFQKIVNMKIVNFLKENLLSKI